MGSSSPENLLEEFERKKNPGTFYSLGKFEFWEPRIWGKQPWEP